MIVRILLALLMVVPGGQQARAACCVFGGSRISAAPEPSCCAASSGASAQPDSCCVEESVSCCAEQEAPAPPVCHRDATVADDTQKCIDCCASCVCCVPREPAALEAKPTPAPSRAKCGPPSFVWADAADASSIRPPRLANNEFRNPSSNTHHARQALLSVWLN